MEKLWGKGVYRVVAFSLRNLMERGEIAAADVVDYVEFWADDLQNRAEGSVSEEEMTIPMYVIQRMIENLIRQNKLSVETWQMCLIELVKIYATMADDVFDYADAGIKKSPIGNRDNSGKFIEKYMVDGKRLTANEIIFYDFCAGRFDEEEWCKKWGIAFDADLAYRLKKKYQSIGWTMDHTKLLTSRRW